MEPPAKRRKPAPRRSARLQSGGAAAAAAAAPASASLSRVAALDALLDDFAGQEAELRRRLEELARRRAPDEHLQELHVGLEEPVHAHGGGAAEAEVEIESRAPLAFGDAAEASDVDI